MFSPLELEKIEFEGSFMGGYKKNNVDEVFALLKNDYEMLYKENIANRDKLTMLDDLVKKYKAMEDAMHSALLLAQTSGDAAVQAAKDKADNLIKEAELRITAMYKEADDQLHKLNQKNEDIKGSTRVFAVKNISLLKSQIEILNQMVSDSREFGGDVSGINANDDEE